MNAYIDALDSTEDLAAEWLEKAARQNDTRFAAYLLVRALVQATKAIVTAIESERR
jgi:hypothetical protein